jgi:hypothetical protein
MDGESSRTNQCAGLDHLWGHTTWQRLSRARGISGACGGVERLCARWHKQMSLAGRAPFITFIMSRIALAFANRESIHLACGTSLASRIRYSAPTRCAIRKSPSPHTRQCHLVMKHRAIRKAFEYRYASVQSAGGRDWLRWQRSGSTGWFVNSIYSNQVWLRYRIMVDMMVGDVAGQCNAMELLFQVLVHFCRTHVTFVMTM